MRDPDRIGRILEKLRLIWAKDPDARLCQMISNVTVDVQDIFYVEDDDLEERLDAYLRMF